MLESRAVADLRSLCPAAYVLGETPAGSGVLCRVTGRIIATATDPSSLRAFCCHPAAASRDVTADGQEVRHGYQHCPVWEHQRKRELAERVEWAQGTPERVKKGFDVDMISPA